MRIYFIGSTSVGKTTLARTIAKYLDLPLLNEVARTIMAERELQFDSLRTNLNTVDDYQTEVFQRQIQEEKRYQKFVSDRSFDNLAYTANYGTCFSKLVNSELMKEYINSLKQDDVIMFFVRPSRITMKNDGIRETVDWDRIVEIDAIIKCLLQLFELRYFQIDTHNMQERIHLVKSVISLKN